MADTSELTKTITDLKKRIAKLEKEIKKNQSLIDEVILYFRFYNLPLFHTILKKYLSKTESKKPLLEGRLQGKKNE